MADTTPDVNITSLRYMLPALDQPTRHALIERLAATSPAPVVEMALSIAERVPDDATFADLTPRRPPPVSPELPASDQPSPTEPTASTP